MAHVMKHTKAACGHMFGHFDRQTENISNENLDRTRTHLNYNIATHQQMDQGEFVRKRCSEVHCQNRKDVNVMVSWVVTAPKDLPQNEEKAFFKAAYDFLEDRYGKDNVVSAYVHMDEVTPHLHFAFVPVTYDQKRDRYKVSAKEVVNRSDLKSFHKDLEKAVEIALGHEVGILNEATKDGNRSIEELKRNTALEKLNTIEGDLERATKRLQKVQFDVKKSMDKLQSLETEKSQIRANLELLAQDIKVLEVRRNAMSLSREVSDRLVAEIEGNSKPARLNKDSYIVPKSLVDRVIEIIKGIPAFAGENKNLHEIVKPAMDILQREEGIIRNANSKANSILKNAKERGKNITLKQAQIEADRYNEITKYQNFFKRHPEIKKMMEQENGNRLRDYDEYER